MEEEEQVETVQLTCQMAALGSSNQRAVMVVVQYGMLSPDCHFTADANTAITSLMCEFCKIFFGAELNREHMVITDADEVERFHASCIQKQRSQLT